MKCEQIADLGRTYCTCIALVQGPQLVVSDLCSKHPAILERKYRRYLYYLLIVAIFYTLPVVQLVSTYNKVVAKTGIEDICYFNFECSLPLGDLHSFNNIYSALTE